VFGLIATPMTGGLSLGFVAASAAIGSGIDLARVEIVDSKDVTNKNFISLRAELEKHISQQGYLSLVGENNFRIRLSGDLLLALDGLCLSRR